MGQRCVPSSRYMLLACHDLSLDRSYNLQWRNARFLRTCRLELFPYEKNAENLSRNVEIFGSAAL